VAGTTFRPAPSYTTLRDATDVALATFSGLPEFGPPTQGAQPLLER
jgi:hypothetical protein